MGLIITKLYEDKISKNQQHAEGPRKSRRALSLIAFIWCRAPTVGATWGWCSWARGEEGRQGWLQPLDPGTEFDQEEGWAGVGSADGVQVWWEQEGP